MESLRTLASDTLGKETLAELTEWYNKALNWADENNAETEEDTYVVFASKRTYELALLLESISGKIMEESDKTANNSNTKFLTDNSIILQCRNMVKAFKNTGHFPSILICIDILTDGCDINSLLDAIKNRLNVMLPECRTEDVYIKLEQAVQINAFKVSTGTSLLYGGYARKLKDTIKTEPGICQKLSNNISKLILRSGVLGENYVYSLSISETEMNTIKETEGENIIRTVYNSNEQYLKTWCIRDGNHIKALLALRFIKFDFGYRVTPLVLIPNLDGAVVNKIAQTFVDRLGIKDLDALLNLYKSFEGMQSYNEFTTFLLCNVMMGDMCKKYNIGAYGEGIKHELRKLAVNYNFNTLRQTQNCLEMVIEHETLSIDELLSKLGEIIPDTSSVLLNFGDSTDTKRVYKGIESYLYDKRLQTEKRLYELKSNAYSSGIEYSQRDTVEAFNLLKDIVNPEHALEVYITWLCQMMNIGMLEVSSYASNNQKVNGLMQFIEIKNQTITNYLLRYHELVPLLACI